MSNPKKSVPEPEHVPDPMLAPDAEDVAIQSPEVAEKKPEAWRFIGGPRDGEPVPDSLCYSKVVYARPGVLFASDRDPKNIGRPEHKNGVYYERNIEKRCFELIVNW